MNSIGARIGVVAVIVAAATPACSHANAPRPAGGLAVLATTAAAPRAGEIPRPLQVRRLNSHWTVIEVSVDVGDNCYRFDYVAVAATAAAVRLTAYAHKLRSAACGAVSQQLVGYVPLPQRLGHRKVVIGSA